MLEEMQKQFAATTSQLQGRVVKLEGSMGILESQVPRMDGKRRQLQETSDRRFLNVQDTCSKLEMALYESQAELALLKNSSDDLMTRERESAHLQKALQLSQEDAMEALKRLKDESSQLQVELYALKEQTNGAASTVASDVQVLAKEYSALRNTVSKQQSQWLGKLNGLQEAIDRQGKMDKAQLGQRVSALADAASTQERRTKEAVDNLLKNHARIRCAVDEGMTICSRELRALGNEVKASQADQQDKLDQVVQQIATNSIECSQRHEDLHLSLRSIAHRLKVSL
jgi:chromosome segregation ATPase